MSNPFTGCPFGGEEAMDFHGQLAAHYASDLAFLQVIERQEGLLQATITQRIRSGFFASDVSLHMNRM